MPSNNIIWPDDLGSLTGEDQETLLVGIRERRAKIGQYAANAKRVSAKLTVGAVKNAIDKELAKFVKEFEKADKAIAAVEKRINNVAALRLQLEDAVGGSETGREVASSG